jgi:uncharacterized protein DUF4386
MSSPKRLARIAGLLYLIVGIFGGFAIAYVTAKVYVPGDAATTAGNVLANAGLVRLGVIADLLQATVFIFLAMVLYVLLKDVHKHVARAMVILVAIATTIMCLNEVALPKLPCLKYSLTVRPGHAGEASRISHARTLDA